MTLSDLSFKNFSLLDGLDDNDGLLTQYQEERYWWLSSADEYEYLSSNLEPVGVDDKLVIGCKKEWD